MRTLRRCLPIALMLACVAGPAGAGADPAGVWPLSPQPAVVSRFEAPAGPYGPGHRGVDLLATAGQVVHSALPGTVSFTGTIAGRGVVVVDHGLTRTTYEPVSAGVGVGTPVLAGAAVGSLQAGGSHCPPRACLHWGWLEGTTYLDPLRLVGAAGVRLLPLWPSTPTGRATVRGSAPGSLPVVVRAAPYLG